MRLLWLWLASGCAFVVTAYPPPEPFPTAMDPMVQGEVEVGGGVRAHGAGGLSGAGPRLAPLMPGYTPGGGAQLFAGVGVADGVDIFASVGPDIDGSAYSLGTSVRVWERDMLRLDLLAGSGMNWVAGEHTDEWTTKEDVDGDGDEEKIDHTHWFTYAYLSFAPTLGARLTVTPHRRWEMPFSFRGSYAFTVPVYGLDNHPMQQDPWFEGASSVVWSPVDRLQIGVGWSLLTSEKILGYGGMVYTRASVSLSGNLNLFGKSK